MNNIFYKIKKITKIKPRLSTTGGTSDARFIKKIAPCLEFGLVGKTMHKIDEAVSLSDLKKLVISIEEAEVKDGGEGAILIRLKNL